MGLLDFLKGKEQPANQPPAATFPVILGAIATGEVIPMEKIPDEVFSTGVLGLCCGIEPDEGKIYAPIAGKISQLTDTLHAVGIEANGLEILIHIGVDTVDMNGDGFVSEVRAGEAVKKGDILLTVDLDKIRAAGHPSTAILAVTNSDDFASVEIVSSGKVKPGDNLLQIQK